MTAQGPGEPTKPPLSALTTLRVGGAADSLVIAETEAELIDAVATADAAGQPATVLGGGSNVVVADAGLPGTVVVVPPWACPQCAAPRTHMYATRGWYIAWH